MFIVKDLNEIYFCDSIETMKICVIGLGYVGLVVSACLADTGNEVICADNDEEKINNLKKGIVPIFEPGLGEILNYNLKNNHLTFTSDIDFAIKKTSVCFICVGTPSNDDGSVDLSNIFDITNKIALSINEYKLIVNKSTVPVGTAQKMEEIIKQKTNCDFDIVSNPEFLKQGSALDDFLHPDRVIIGSNSERATKIMQEIYSPFFRTENRLIVMDVKSAEMTKYASNSFLATKISFMNEISLLCEKLDADIRFVRMGMASDSRIGNKFLFPGLGYGGSCLPKDVKALIKLADENNIETPLINAVDKVNFSQREYFIKKILKRFNNKIENLNFGIWGLSFKPKTDDIRYAPSVTIISELLKRNAKIKVYDPKAIDNVKKIFDNKIAYCNNSYDAIKNCDCMLLLTEWNEFRRLDFDKIINIMKTPIIFDGRNQFDPDELKCLGIEYYCIGVKTYPF